MSSRKPGSQTSLKEESKKSVVTTEQEEPQPKKELIEDFTEELTQGLKSLQDLNVSRQVWKQIMSLKDEISVEEKSVDTEGAEAQLRQRLTFKGLDGKTISAKGDLIRRSLDLIQRWGKTRGFVENSDGNAEEEEETQLPSFTAEEIYGGRFFDRDNELSIQVTDSQFSGTEGLARLVVAHAAFQLDRLNEFEADLGELKVEMAATETVPYACLLDCLQFIDAQKAVEAEDAASSVVLRFYYTKNMAAALKREAEAEAERKREEAKIEKEKKKAHEKKWQIVEDCKWDMEEKEEKAQMSVIDEQAFNAQKDFEQVDFNDEGFLQVYKGPPKYLKQRDQPLEIPMECIRKLCDAVDTSYDDRITTNELKNYVAKLQLPFEEGVCEKMYAEAIAGRGACNEKQRTKPLSYEEIAATVRGRHCWNTETKKWQVKYRQFRNYWIVLLLSVNERIFALPMPKVVPGKIRTQYELEDRRKNPYHQSQDYGVADYGAEDGDFVYDSLGQRKQYKNDNPYMCNIFDGNMDFAPTLAHRIETLKFWKYSDERIEFYKKHLAESVGNPHQSKAPIEYGRRGYLEVQAVRPPPFVRQSDKIEGNVKPELGGTIKVTDKKQKLKEENAFEAQVNASIKPPVGGEDVKASNPVNFPKVTFKSKEMFEQAYSLSQKIPHWQTEKENPIYQYVPKSEVAFKTVSENELQKERFQAERSMKLQSLQGKERPLMLAGTMLLNKRATSPLSKLKETRGMVTVKRVPDITEQKISLAKTEIAKSNFKYATPKEHEFRNFDTLAFNQKDFALRTKPDKMENPHAIAEYQKQPKYHFEKHYQRETKIREAEGLASKQSWVRHHPLPDKLVNVSQKLRDPYSFKQKEPTPFMDKDAWESAYLQLSRTVKDDLVVGKPALNLYYKQMKPEDKEKELDGTYKPFKVIS